MSKDVCRNQSGSFLVTVIGLLTVSFSPSWICHVTVTDDHGPHKIWSTIMESETCMWPPLHENSHSNLTLTMHVLYAQPPSSTSKIKWYHIAPKSKYTRRKIIENLKDVCPIRQSQDSFKISNDWLCLHTFEKEFRDNPACYVNHVSCD